LTGIDHIAGWMRRRRAVRRRFNPYIVGTPVFDRQLFFGREKLVVRALSLLDSHSLQLTGERRIGKTSFLHHLQGILAAENGGTERRSFPVFVDLEAVTARDLFHVLMEEAVEALAVAARTLAGLRFNRGHSEYLAADFAHDLRRVIEELSSRTRLPVRLVFLIDEIDAVREGPAANGDSWLGPLLLNGSPEFRVVLASVGRAASGPDEAPSRRGALDALELEPFAPGDAEALVREPVAGVFRYEPRAVERILQVSRLRPYAIQKLCLNAVNRMLDEGRSTVRVSDVGELDSLRVQSGEAPELHEAARSAFTETERP
jgi:hypothetical protein